MDETDYFQKRDKYKKKVVDDEWGALKKIKAGQEPKKKPSLKDQEKQNPEQTDETQSDGSKPKTQPSF
ncbi:MAG: hypothetical protein IIA62_09745 [Nitrospinae bacterium]|nr:hypothetical protein [Nitrospinota bacterium]